MKHPEYNFSFISNHDLKSFYAPGVLSFKSNIHWYNTSVALKCFFQAGNVRY